MLTARLLPLISVFTLILSAPTPARAEVWDVFTWDYLRVWSDWFDYTDIHTGGGSDVVRKPGLDEFSYPATAHLMEMRQWDYDNNAFKIRFTFDGSRLALNRDGLSSVGGSSEQRYALRLAGRWAAVGTVSEGSLSIDPFAQFTGTGYGCGYINWSPDTPVGYSTQLLLGFDFPDNGAATYTEANWPNYSVTSTMALDSYLPKMPNQSHAYRRVNPHTFTLTYSPVVPEPSSLSLLATGLGWILISARRRK